MDHRINDIDELIGKYLAGEASAPEAQQVEAWAQESEANRKHLHHFKTIFEKSSTINVTHTFDEDAAWKKLKAKIAQQHEGKTVSMKPDSGISFFWRIAAGIIVVIGIGFFAYRFTQSDPKTTDVISGNNTVTDTLPDGSDVFLNKKSQLTYSFDKKKKEHRVKLIGEAYFSINHDDNKTFIVELGDVYIKDIGTSFNVKAYPDSDLIEVVVIEGAVMFYSEHDSGNYLQANGKGIYNKKTKTFSLDQPESNALSYKTRFFVFSNTPLEEVAIELNKVYDKKVIIANHLKNCDALNVTFNNESLDEITNVIAETMGLTKTETPDGILLDGKCGN